MSQSAALDIVHRYYTAFNAGDRETFFSLLTEDVVHDINQGGSETGVSAFRAFMDRMDSCYREQLEDLVLMAEGTGERVAAEFTVRGEYLASDEGLPPASGQTYQLRAGAFFSLREGRIARVTMYYNLTEWLRQVS